MFFVKGIYIETDRLGGAVGLSLVCRKLGVQIPVATDMGSKTGNDSSTAKRSAIGVSVKGPQK